MRTSPGVFVAANVLVAACVALVANTMAAQVPAATPATDSLALTLSRLQRDLSVALSTWAYWADTRPENDVGKCQVRYSTFCVADHYVPLHRGGPLPPNWPQSPIPADGIIKELERGVQIAPDNGWFVGQLLLFRALAQPLDSVLALVHGCRAQRWWCLALEGLVMHKYERFGRADTVFAEALREMPTMRRCEWRNLGRLLNAADRAALEQLACAAREPLEDRIWWLSDPLYMLEGNDRRTEHYARRVLDSLFTGAISPFGWPWSPELSDMLQRFGLPTHWIISPAWAHFETPSYHFIPRVAIPAESTAFSADSWDLKAPLNDVLERYRPPYGYLAELTHAQVAAFPRGDSMLIAAALGLDEEAIDTVAPFVVGLALSQHPSQQQLRTIGQVTGIARFTMSAARVPSMISLEAMSNEWQVAGRLRYMLHPATDTGPAVSDLLLFSSRARLPSRVDEAVRGMLGSNTVQRSDPLGIYWETYRFPADSIRLTLSVSPVGNAGSLLARIARSVSGRSESGTVLLRWTEAATTGWCSGSVDQR
jgi:hypothetical protein